MRPTQVLQNAVGSSVWIPIDYVQLAFGVGLAVRLSSGASLTYTVQHTFDDFGPDNFHPVVATRTGTTVTVTDLGPSIGGTTVGHGLITGDAVQISGSATTGVAGAPLGLLDGYQSSITYATSTTYTYTTTASGAVTDIGTTLAANFRVFPHAVLTSQSTSQDGNYAFPVTGIRLNISAYTSGYACLRVIQGGGP